MIVYKIGGSCLKENQSLNNLIRTIREEKKPLIVVISALHGVTSFLERAAHAALKNESAIPVVVQELREKHYRFLRKHLQSELLLAIAHRQLEPYLQKLENDLKAVFYSEELSSSLRSRILACGERLSAIIFSTILNDCEIGAQSFQSDELGIICDEDLENSSILLEKTAARLLTRTKKWEREQLTAVITGFFGISTGGRIALLGRNSSDYSAAALARIFSAEKLIIWKDSSGVQSADPQIVPEAFAIEELNYAAASELAYFGAKILHPRTLEPLLKTTTRIEVRSALQPENFTVILNYSDFTNLLIAHNTEVSILRILGPSVGFRPGIIARLSTILNDQAINILSIITSQTAINLLLNSADARKCARLLKTNNIDPAVQELQLNEECALLAVIGAGLIRRRGVAALILNSISEAAINIELMAAGASDASFYLIVRKEDLTPAIRAIHAEFLHHREMFPFHIPGRVSRSENLEKKN